MVLSFRYENKIIKLPLLKLRTCSLKSLSFIKPIQKHQSDSNLPYTILVVILHSVFDL
ncbi:hypothetical protein VCHA53O473_30051 [Vibrio chagasii]|nr:hypothetical protein VCHA43P275_30253 [Vibrio chagasii]CAH7302368.1 hypothetical protein VCHA53O473_30051 [Vibrio chagasii]CAH7325167.1 hypothetical protein VCHA40P240_50263 [Vibrio chagasii]